MPTVEHPLLEGTPFEPIWRRALRVLATGLVGGLLVSFVGTLGHELVRGELWMVNEVTFSGQVNASEVGLRHLSDIPKGAHLFEVDLLTVVRKVERHPWVRRAEARRVMPGTIEITIEEHQPVMLLALDAFWYVGADGRPFKLAEADNLDFPVLTGLTPTLVEKHPVVARAVLDAAMVRLEACDGHPVAGPEHLSEIRFDPAGGFTLVLRDGSELYLGFSDATAALRRLDRLWQAGLRLDHPTRVDLEAPQIAVATPIPDPA